MRWTGERPTDSLIEQDARYLGQIVEHNFAGQYVAGKSVLDIGCGEGHGSVVLAKNAREVDAVDVSEEAVALARQCYPFSNLRFHRMGAERLDFPDASFDTVTSFQVIEHLPDPGPYVREMARVLKPDGLCVVTTPNRLTSVGENPFHVHEFSPGELKMVLGERFAEVTMLGYYGNEKVQALWRVREQTIRGILALDVFGLRRHLPRRLILKVHPWLYLVSRVIRGAIGRVKGYPNRLSLEDYTISDKNTEQALSLIAVCKGPRKGGSA
jgi:SAM-dependent methyltransferase